MDANFVSTVLYWPKPAEFGSGLSRNLLIVVLLNPSYTTTKRSYSETEYELISNSESDRSLKRLRFYDEDIAIPEMQPLTSIITFFDLLIVVIQNPNFPDFSDSVRVFANTMRQDKDQIPSSEYERFVGV